MEALKFIQSKFGDKIDVNREYLSDFSKMELAELLEEYAGKHFTELNEHEQQNRMNEDLQEIKCWFGGWDELRERINDLEQSDFEQAFENRYSY